MRITVERSRQRQKRPSGRSPCCKHSKFRIVIECCTTRKFGVRLLWVCRACLLPLAFRTLSADRDPPAALPSAVRHAVCIAAGRGGGQRRAAAAATG